jgi:hypothetical protein
MLIKELINIGLNLKPIDYLMSLLMDRKTSTARKYLT